MLLSWTSDVSKPTPPEMSCITRGIARNLSSAIRQRERQYLEGFEGVWEGVGGGDTEWIVPQQPDGPFSLIFLELLLQKTKERRGKNAQLFLSPPISNSLISPRLPLPSFFISSYSFVHPSLANVSFLKKKKRRKNPLNPLERLLLLPLLRLTALLCFAQCRTFDVLISCSSPHPRLSYPSLGGPFISPRLV